MRNHPTDPSQNFIDRYPHPLDPLFHPRTVAVIGAKDDPRSVGRTIMVNLTTGSFSGKVFPVNPKRQEVLGFKSYPSVSAISEKIDLAVIVSPASTVPAIVRECTEAGVKSAIIISAGFKELGEEGQKLEDEILSYARKGKMPIIGPNCLGVMNPIGGVNATFAQGMALPGNLAFISQSGAMCTAVLDWSLQTRVGFSAFVSVGSMADVNWGSLIDYLGSDPHTDCLLLYMETVGDAASFMTAAREVALEKPIIVIKAGRSQEAAKAAASHTGSLAGSDEVFDAALERIGVMRVDTIAELFNLASVLAKQPLPKGPHLTIVTNAGGPGVLATDATITHHAVLTPLSKSVVSELDSFLPKAWSKSNPVDILGDADPERYAKAVDVLLNDQEGDGLLIILTPQDMTDPTLTAVKIKELSKKATKPLFASWMGGNSVKEGSDVLSDAKIPVFRYPDDAAKTFSSMWEYSRNLKRLYEFPQVGSYRMAEESAIALNEHPKRGKMILAKALQEGKILLNEFDSKQVLQDYGIPIVETILATNAAEAATCANGMGYPVVLKLSSATITHKSDIGGVKLNLNSAEEVKRAFDEIEKAGQEHFDGVTVQKMIKHRGIELILGSSVDPQFGPVILFGLGGQWVEIFKDKALAIPPLNQTLARHLMQKTKIYEALLGARGMNAVNLFELEEILINFSRLIVENPRIKECDINPLLANDKELIALDARILLHGPEIKDDHLPGLVIRPYPTEYVVEVSLKEGIPCILRPIRPEDESMVINFHRQLSEQTIRSRYFEFMSLDARVAHERLIRICFNDYNREWAIVAEIAKNDQKEIIGIGRLMRLPGINRAQFKLIIRDDYHRVGLGSKLLAHLLYIAKKENIDAVDGYILSENEGMLHICKKQGFVLHATPDNPVIHAELNL